MNNLLQPAAIKGRKKVYLAKINPNQTALMIHAKAVIAAALRDSAKVVNLALAKISYKNILFAIKLGRLFL